MVWLLRVCARRRAAQRVAGAAVSRLRARNGVVRELGRSKPVVVVWLAWALLSRCERVRLVPSESVFVRIRSGGRAVVRSVDPFGARWLSHPTPPGHGPRGGAPPAPAPTRHRPVQHRRRAQLLRLRLRRLPAPLRRGRPRVLPGARRLCASPRAHPVLALVCFAVYLASAPSVLGSPVELYLPPPPAFWHH